jgi:hypothetical protein
MHGSYIVCSKHILGKFAKQLDITLDDGVGNTGSLMSMVEGAARPAAGVAIPDDSTLYTVCMGI